MRAVLTLGGENYATLSWPQGQLHATLSPQAKGEGFADALATEALKTYDPRTGAITAVRAGPSQYDSYLWCSQWVQERILEGRRFGLWSEGIDFSLVIPPIPAGALA